ncbi:hypothetical protein BKI52_30610 [marine bacterium AO1-C]|nr:hypothetical protein BKI52_30610 [marine bacterium AO1-C]
MAQAQKTVLLDGTKQIKNLGPNLQYLRDDSQKLTLSQILSAPYQKKFIAHKKDNLNLGPGEAVVWIKLNIRANRPTKYLLEFGDTGVEEIILFKQNKQQQYVPLDTLGDNMPYYHRPVKATKFLFELDIKDRKVHTIYLRCYAFEVLTFPLRIGSYKAFLEDNHQTDFIMGGFYGVVLIMIFYNLFIFITTRQLSYLYYIFYVIFSVLTTSTLKGHALEFLWPNQTILNDWVPIYAIITGIFVVLFANRFLNTKVTAPRFRKLSNIFYVLFALAFIINFFYAPAAIGVTFLAIITSSIFVVILGVVVLRNNYHPARYYLIGWATLVVSLILVAFSNMGFLPFDTAYSYVIEAGMTSEILLFSLALADRMNYYRKENDRIIREQKEYLEHEVTQRTKEIEQQKEEILAQSQTLEDSNHYLKQAHTKIQSSIQYAKRIQLALLPMQKQLAKKDLGFFVLYKPRDIVSGDFYWFAEVEDKNQLIVLVADCTGHGVPGAFMTIMGTNLLNQIVKENRTTSPGAILEELDKKVVTALGVRTGKSTRGKSKNKVQDGMDLALCRIDFDQKQVTFAGAKRPLYYFKNHQLEVIKGSKYPIGSSQYATKQFEENCITYQKGDAMYLFSDGYADQFGGEHNTKFMVKKFKSKLQEIEASPMPDQKEVLEKTLDTWKGEEKQTDDILVMGVRF